MILRDLMKYARISREIRAENSELFEYLQLTGKFFEAYYASPQKIAASPLNDATALKRHITDMRDAINKNTNNAAQFIRGKPPFQFMPLVTKLQADLSQLNDFYVSEKMTNLKETALQELIESHTHAYAEKDFARVSDFIQRCKRFTEQFELFSFFAEGIEGTVARTHEKMNQGRTDYSEFSLYLEQSGNGANEFAKILMSICVLYTIVCQIEGINEVDDPLIMMSIESGSKAFKLTGKELVIGIIITIFLQAQGLITEYTKGLISQKEFEDRVGKMERILELEKKAASNKDPKTKEALNAVIRKMLIEVSGDSTYVELNDKTILNLKQNERGTQKSAPQNLLQDHDLRHVLGEK